MMISQWLSEKQRMNAYLVRKTLIQKKKETDRGFKVGVKKLQATFQLGNGSAQYKRPNEMRTQWLRKAVNVLSQSILRAVSVGGLHGPPYVILPKLHTSWQKKNNQRKPWGWAVAPLAFLLGESRGGRDQDKL